jgi:hypothetical protein
MNIKPLTEIKDDLYLVDPVHCTPNSMERPYFRAKYYKPSSFTINVSGNYSFEPGQVITYTPPRVVFNGPGTTQRMTFTEDAPIYYAGFGTAWVTPTQTGTITNITTPLAADWGGTTAATTLD